MAWWQYLLLANLYLILFYGFYVLLLRRETFFQLNRVYLVASALLSFMIPAIQADWVQKLFITQQVNQIIYNQPLIIYNYTAQAEDNRITIGQILAMIYAAGIVFLTLRLLWQLLQLSKFVKQPQAVAFSFFKKININAGVSDADVIMAHEEVHAKQWHSADVLIMEAIMILNWFNPVVYFYRRAIKHIHEFIADSKVVSLGVDKAGYAMLLLNHTMNAPSHGLVNQFLNHSLLKKRIIMLQKNRSQRVKLLKYGLSAPLFALMIILSSATINNTKAVKAINKTAEKVLEAPATIAVATTLASADKAINNVIDNNIKTDNLKQSTDTIPEEPNEVFTAVEQVPEFPGGMSAFSKFLAANLRYPEEMRKKKIEGRVFITYVVEKDGSLSGLKILRDIGHGSGEEAIRTLSLSPKWKPGYQNGRPVRVQYNIPIAFYLGVVQNSKEDKNELFTEVENVPEFTGGVQAFNKFLSKNIHYPKADRDAGTEGRVFIRFVVEKDGSLSEIRVLRGVSETIDAEALRVISLSPKWKSGYQNGKPVRVEYNVPIAFSLGGKTDKTALPDTGITSKAGTESVNGFKNYKTNSPTYSIGISSPSIFQQTYKITLDVPSGKAFNKPGNQLILLDGEEISKKTMDALDSKAIASVNVFKDDEAITRFGEKGKNGVIVITSKANKAPGQAASNFFTEGTSSLNADPALRPLIIIDGVEKSYDELQKIDVNKIGSINVLKDAASIKRYGEKGKNGVIEVSTAPKKQLNKKRN